MLIFPCHVCKTPLSAEVGQAGQLVRCPTCLTTLRVPAASAAQAAVPLAKPAPRQETVKSGAFAGATQGAAGASSAASSSLSSSSTSTATASPPVQRRVNLPPQFRAAGGGKHYGFNCGYCSSRLEATESAAGQ